MLWSSVATSDRADAPADRPDGAVERLRAGHFVDEMEIDEEEIRFALGGADDMRVPDLLAQCLAHGSIASLFYSGLPAVLRLHDPMLDLHSSMRDGSIKAWTTLAVSAFSTKPPSS